MLEERLSLALSVDLKTALNRVARENRRKMSDQARIIFEEWFEAQKQKEVGE